MIDQIIHNSYMWMALLESTTLIIGVCWVLTHYKIYHTQVIIVMLIMLGTSLYNSPWFMMSVPETHHHNRFFWDVSFFMITVTFLRYGLINGLKWGKWWQLEVTTRFPTICEKCIDDGKHLKKTRDNK